MRFVLGSLIGLVALSLSLPAAPQIGGTGVDGTFLPKKDVTLNTAFRGGHFHFTKVHIPKGVTVRLEGPNPAIIHSQGSIQIDGVLSADGRDGVGPVGTKSGGGGEAGCAGFAGGSGAPRSGTAGLGPGGGLSGGSAGGGAGHATTGGGTSWSGRGGRAYGATRPFDTRGGSGGAGGSNARYLGAGGGGGGGTLILISGSKISLSGLVSANGGAGGRAYGNAGGGGSGGSVLMWAAGLVEIGGAISTFGGKGGGSNTRYVGGAGSPGFIRLDSLASMPAIRGTVTPLATLLRLPDLDVPVLKPKLGQSLTLDVTSVGKDAFVLFMSGRGGEIKFPVWGTWNLDPGSMFLIGATAIPDKQFDARSSFRIPIPNDPKLKGTILHFQGINILSPYGRPKFSNSVIRSLF